MMKRSNRFQRKPRPVARHCLFCEGSTEPDYKEPMVLGRYLTERGKIVSKDNSGTCSTHQRALTQAIKRARHVALLPFVVRA